MSRLTNWLARQRATHRELVAFVLVGGVNTLLTYGIYLALLRVVSYPVAFTGSYVTGIFLSYYLNARFVFREPVRLSKALQYPVVYVVQYLLGVGLLYLFVEQLHFNKAIAPLAIVLITVPCTFVLSRYVIRGRAKAGARL